MEELASGIVTLLGLESFDRITVKQTKKMVPKLASSVFSCISGVVGWIIVFPYKKK